MFPKGRADSDTRTTASGSEFRLAQEQGSQRKRPIQTRSIEVRPEAAASPFSRRRFLERCSTGFGAVALAGLMHEQRGAPPWM